jgi:hypothetical protein
LGLGRIFRGRSGQDFEAKVAFLFRGHDTQRLGELLTGADDDLVILIVHPRELNGGQVGKDGESFLHEVLVGEAISCDRQTADLAIERKLQRSQ